MMLSKAENRKKIGENSGGKKLLNDIEAISKALYLDKNQQKGSISSASNRYKSLGKAPLPESRSKLKDGNKDSVEKEKKSIWSWKGLKAFTHVRHRKFNCCFSLQVHCIEGLPPYFDDLSLVIYWKRRDVELVTRAVTVIEGVAEFEEHLTHTCSVYGSRSGPHHSAKYEAKHFLLYASVYGAPELDLGKHRMDLTRILPLTLEELEEEKCSSKWTTSFRLSGKAKGAILNVSFGYMVLADGTTGPTTNSGVPEARHLRQYSGSSVKILGPLHQSYEGNSIRRAGILPARSSISSRSVEDIKDLHEILPISKSELSESVNILYQKLDGDKSDVSVDSKPDIEMSKPDINVSEPEIDFSKPEIDVSNPEIDVFTKHLEPLKPVCDLPSDAGKVDAEAEDECEIGEFSVIEQGVEQSLKEELKPEEEAGHGPKEGSLETNNLDGITHLGEAQLHPSVDEIGGHQDELFVSDCNSKRNDSCSKELLLKDLEFALNSFSDSMKEGIDSQEDEYSNEEDNVRVKSNYGAVRQGKSLSFDDVSDCVASEFLDMLGIEHSPLGLSSESEPESPRERLLRQFEKDALANGHSLFNFGMDSNEAEFSGNAPAESGWRSISEELNHSSISEALDEMPKIESEPVRNRSRASELEGLETEALMREWGLNEKAFQHSPPDSRSGFGSPIDLPPEDPYELPSLVEGLGTFIQTRNGGFLRSMNPALFRNAKNEGNLIMQVSNPVVVPAEMGSGIMDILQHLSSVGIEKLSAQANKLMPLEDLTGKTVQQIAWETSAILEGPERKGLLPHESELEHNASCGKNRVKVKSSKPRSDKFESSSANKETDSEYVSLEDLAPLAMEKIEALSVEGLKIQSGMSDEDAPSNIYQQSIGEFSAFEGKRVNAGGSIGLEGTGGLQLLDIKDNGDDVDGLMGLSLTLDEWMKLDAGEIDDDDLISEKTSRILAAHHANSADLIRGRSKGEKKRGKGRKGGFLGDNFTVALMVQLRDPLRNYEPVGTPMLALIQVERVFVPPKPKIYSTVSEVRKNNEEEDEPEPIKEEEVKEETKEEKIPEEDHVPQYKITEVHVAGFKTEPGKKKLWGSSTQQQSGSRWLLANGMGKKNKHPLMKSKAVGKSSPADSKPATATVQPGDTLWSISSRIHGTGAKWKELAALNPHIRNPNIIFPNETIRLR